jgi:hypothetical protein
MLQSIIGVLFGTNNKIKIQLDKSIYYTGEEVKLNYATWQIMFYYFYICFPFILHRLLERSCLRLTRHLNIMRL